MALTSLFLAGVLQVYWLRCRYGHVDTFTMGKGSQTETYFISELNRAGQAQIEVDAKSTVNFTDVFKVYLYRNILGYFLIIPGLWVAIKVRSWLPRPPGRVKNRMTKLE